MDDTLKREIRTLFLRDLVARTKIREEIRKTAEQASKRSLDLEAFHDGRMDGMIDVMYTINDLFAVDLQSWKTAGAYLEKTPAISEK